MSLTITHKFVSAKADSTDVSLINPSNWNDTHEITNFPFIIVGDYNFTAQTPGGSLIVGSNTVTLSPVPSGVNGTDSSHYLFISNGTGAAEAVLITGGTAVSGAASGTVIVTCANTHSGAWTIQSATAGWQEAAQAAGANKTIFFEDGTYDIYSSFTAPFSGQAYVGLFADNIFIRPANSSNITVIAFNANKSNLLYYGLGFEGNYVNQTYPGAVQVGALQFNVCDKVNVKLCRFHGFGYSDVTYAVYAQIIQSTGSTSNIRVSECNFQSNLATEIVYNPTYGGVIEGCQFGNPLVTKSQTHINYWDTYSGGFGIIVANSNNIIIRNNWMYGCQRASNLSSYGNFIGVNGSGGPASNKIKIHDNYFSGLGNGIGTVSVTNGSGAIVGTNTAFQTSIDVHRNFMVEGDGTIYTISACASSTGLTVTPVMVRGSASGLRYQYVNSGDAIAVYNTVGLSITNNVVEYSGDNAYDVAASGNNVTEQFLFSGNRASYSQVNGLFLGGAVFNGLISTNQFTNNCLRQLTGHQGAIELSPTNQGGNSAKSMWRLTFDCNTFIDSQTVSTQISGFAIEVAQISHIFDNILTSSNSFFAYNNSSPIGGMFDASTTAAMVGTAFNSVPVCSPIQLTTIKFSDLGGLSSGTGLQNGMIVYCYDAKGISDGVAAGSTAIAGGNGAILAYQNSLWKVGF